MKRSWLPLVLGLAIMLFSSPGARSQAPPGKAPATHEPPAPKIMYFDTPVETKLAILLKRRKLKWPVMRIGIGDSHGDLYGMLRLFVTKGVTRAEICREAKDSALIAFRAIPHLAQIDIDAAEQDDTKIAKATPWFVASVNRTGAESTDVDWPPEKWLVSQGFVSYGTALEEDGSPAQTVVGALLSLYEDGLQRIPVQRSHPPKH